MSAAILKQRAKNLCAFYAKVLEYQIPTGMLLDLEISFFVFEGGQWADQVQGLETTATGSVLEIQPAGCRESDVLDSIPKGPTYLCGGDLAKP